MIKAVQRAHESCRALAPRSLKGLRISHVCVLCGTGGNGTPGAQSGHSAGYAGLNLVEGGVANLCLVLHRDKLRHIGHDWPSLHRFLLADNRYLGEILHAADPRREKPIVVSDLPFGFVREPVSTTCYCRGDQFAVVSSLTG